MGKKFKKKCAPFMWYIFGFRMYRPKCKQCHKIHENCWTIGFLQSRVRMSLEARTYVRVYMLVSYP